MHLETSSPQWPPFCIDLSVLKCCYSWDIKASWNAHLITHHIYHITKYRLSFHLAIIKNIALDLSYGTFMQGLEAIPASWLVKLSVRGLQSSCERSWIRSTPETSQIHRFCCDLLPAQSFLQIHMCQLAKTFYEYLQIWGLFCLVCCWAHSHCSRVLRPLNS